MSEQVPTLASNPGTLGELRPEFGFKIGVSGAHAARTMMLMDLTALLAAAPKEAKREDFNRLIVDENLLGKRTTSNRWLTARHLADLYAFDHSVTIFRLLRFFWDADATSRPMLALLCAQARDALLRFSARKVLEMKPGETLTSKNFVDFFNLELPGRFNAGMASPLGQALPKTDRSSGCFAPHDC
jgi:hypothetical protein